MRHVVREKSGAALKTVPLVTIVEQTGFNVASQNIDAKELDVPICKSTFENSHMVCKIPS